MTTILQAGGPPPTRAAPVKDVLHGVELVDPYRWLEDQNSPETRAWVGEQNKYTRSLLDAVPGRERLKKRLGELMRIDSLGRPFARGGRYFLSRKSANQEQPVLIVRQGLNGADEVLVDPNALGLGKNTSVSYEDVSADGALAAYSVTTGGKDESAIRILDVATKRLLKDELPEARYISFSFREDKSGFFYTLSGGDHPRVREHRMGTPVAEDRDVFGEGYGAKHILACEVSEDGAWLAITVWVGSSGDVAELWVKDLRAGTPARSLFPGVEASFRGTIAGGRAIVQTNWKAPNWRILSVDLAKTGPDNAKELVPESKSSISDFSLVGGKMLVSYLEDVKARVKIFSIDGKHEADLPLPGVGAVSGMSGRWKDPELFYSFTSFHVPPQIYRMNLATGSNDLWFKLNAPVDSSMFEVNQVWYQSKDGTRVPMFLMHKKGLRKDGKAPVLLGGYGGFNVSNTPAYSSSAVVWAELGGIYALANLRGGGEFGEEWHRAGMLGNKQNVFDDFIGAAEFLIREKYTEPSRLAISGGSNGGLLVGAALTQRPDLYRAVICSYPLLDMVRYHKFLVARFWIPEYGSSDDPEQFRWLKTYSPYHNVKKGVDYPAVMVVTGDSDTRVDPLHGRKFAALLQANTLGKRPVLLHYDTEAGHAGVMSTTKSIDEGADRLTFLVSQLGVKLR